MEIHLKRIAKSLALDAMRVSHPLAPNYITRAILRLMKIGFEPLSDSLDYPSDARAACCISVDFDATEPSRLHANHEGTKAILKLAERHDISITWAICGKTAEEDPEAYQAISKSDAGHEIAIHTYSHIDVSSCSPEELEGEIERCKKALGLHSLPRTFIFPWNKEGHFPTLRKMGFLAYRGPKRIIGGPIKTNGLWNIPPVYYVGEKSFGASPLIKRFIDFCIACHSAFHLWLHPWSIVQDGSCEVFVRKTLEPVFKYLD